MIGVIGTAKRNYVVFALLISRIELLWTPIHSFLTSQLLRAIYLLRLPFSQVSWSSSPLAVCLAKWALPLPQRFRSQRLQQLQHSSTTEDLRLQPGHWDKGQTSWILAQQAASHRIPWGRQERSNSEFCSSKKPGLELFCQATGNKQAL